MTTDGLDTASRYFAVREVRLLEHPEAEELIAYHQGHLTPDGEEQCREHLVDCPECGSLVVDLDSFPHLDGDDGPPPAEIEVHRSWRALESRIETEPGVAARPREAVGRYSRRSTALAASLVIALAGLGSFTAWLWQQNRRLVEPQLNAPIVDLFPAAFDRGSASEPRELELAAGAEQIVVILNLPAPESYPTYTLEILDASGQVAWQRKRQPLTENANLIVILTRRVLGPGHYTFRLYGDDPGGPKLVEEYGLSLRFAG